MRTALAVLWKVVEQSSGVSGVYKVHATGSMQCMYMHACVRTCVRMCVCVKERERERKSER